MFGLKSHAKVCGPVASYRGRRTETKREGFMIIKVDQDHLFP